LGALGATGLLLASLGLYGIVSYIVASRVTEFGVRMALGASAAVVGREVLRRGLALTLAGLAIGLALSLGLARLLSALLAGLSPADPVAFGASAIILLSVGVAASYLPARRAVRVDPAIALRAE
jgi:putative ABC transport system permease protein